MGGVGSGGWNRSGRGTVEARRAITIGRLQRAGALQPGWAGSWTWTADGEDNGHVGVEGGHDRLRLAWRIRRQGEPWARVEQEIAIRWRPCRLGGERPFLACAGCGGDRLKLYLEGHAFACRQCLDLSYSSQRERERARLLRRASRLRVRLGSHPGLDMGVPERPRYMRCPTYRRLVGELRHIELGVQDEATRMQLRCEGQLAGRAEGFWT